MTGKRGTVHLEGVDLPAPKRATSRANAGVPPERLGCGLNVSSGTKNPRPPPPPKSLSSENCSSLIASSGRRNSTSSTRTSKSTRSTVRQLEIDVTTEADIDKLREDYELHEHEVVLKEHAVKMILDDITARRTELGLLQDQNSQPIPGTNLDQFKQLQEGLQKLQATLKDKQEQVEKQRIDLNFELKTLKRKEAQLRREAELRKQQIAAEEEDEDRLSQDLSDNEDNQSINLVEDEVFNEFQQEQQEEELVRERVRRNDARQATKRLEEALQKAYDASKEKHSSLEDDELLQRLRNLKDPFKNPSTTEGNEPKIDTPISTASNSSEALSNQLAQVLSLAFEKVAGSSSTNNTDKFLARQVQGKDLPIFTGKPEEWSIFITAFENSTQGCGYSNMDNLPRLQKAIRGEALKTIHCLLSRHENVPTIISKLRMRYGRPEHIVQLLINKAKEVPAFKEDRLDLLIEFGVAVDNLVETIKSLNCLAHLTSPQLLEEFARKLPVSLRTDWMKWVSSDPARQENIEHFANWMSFQTEIACKIAPPKPKDDADHRKPWDKPRRKEEKVWAMDDNPKSSKPFNNQRIICCLICDAKGHQAHQCRQLKKMELDDRWKIIKAKHLCFGCLKYGHSSRDCRNKKECGKNNCDRTHHHLLHKDNPAPERHPKKQESTEEVMGHATGTAAKGNRVIGQVKLMILPIQIKGPKGIIKTYAMLDPGATVTVMDDEIATRLGLEGEVVPFVHSGLHPRIEEKNSRTVSAEILNNKGDKSFLLNNIRTKERLHLPEQSIKRKVLNNWRHLKYLPIECYDNGSPTILIGMDNFQLCTTLEVKMGPGNAPAAGRTELGWVLLGRTNETLRADFCGTVFEKTDEELHQLVKYHFTTEAFGVKVTSTNPRSKEDIVAQQIMDNTIRRVGDSWESGLLWKSDEVKLPNTKQLALSRLYQMERRMDRDPEFARQYVAKIEEYKQKGFACVLSPEEARVENDRTFYLPHFMARNPKKPKKLRFVFDAAAKVSGVSFNDALLKGPDKLTSLPGILLKFRQRVIGVTADIQDMFHRVRIRKEDANAQRFLWRGLDRNRDPDVLQMGVLIFGAACSPACAQEAKNLNAADFQDKYPEGTKAIIKYHYVDDYLDSIDTVEEAVNKFKEIREIHMKGGFNLCNWISNNHELLSAIPQDLHAPGVKNMDLDSDAERVLGLFWKPEQDYFTFSTTFLKTSKELMEQKRLPTKRELLALVMSIYDPLGFLSIFTVKAKMLLQDTWRLGVGWDDELPNGLHERWERWNDELHRIDTFQLPRCHSQYLSRAEEIQLHIMCDASEQGFGAVAYFRIRTSQGIEVSLVMSKARVAPTKHLTLPRLELQAALLGARISSFIKAEHDIKIHRTVYWSDNTTVLNWLRSEGARYKQFVACRVGEILEISNAGDWKYIPTKENVADEMTRESQPCNWSVSSRWINGPEFLKKEASEWPREPVRRQLPQEKDMELKKEFVCYILQANPLMDIRRFSNFNRAVRSMAYVFRFIENCRYNNLREAKGELVPEEIRKAELWWFKQSQSEDFPMEIRCMKNNKPLPPNSKIKGLGCILDEDGIIRIQGRLENADLPIETKRPVVLDSKNMVTILLIAKYHNQNGHHGQEKIVNELKQRFHIMGVRVAVKKCWKECQQCKIARAQPIVPQMGQLPTARLESYVRAFTNTGLDYFGPMIVTVGRRREKRWVALFTCLSTRAVHLELVSSLNTDSCIMAIRRFISRRGHPSHMHSDNGTNFVGTDRELRKALQELNQQQLTAECTTREITWHFIPPHAPHMGGSWERLVKSVKVALLAILKEVHPREEVMMTVLAEAEAVVNSHPLTHVSVDPSDPVALTPNHFLLGGSSGDQVPGHFSKTDLCLRKQWRLAQQLANHFWRRWVIEYMPTLLRRTKWCQQTEPIQIGDVVLVVDNQLVRSSWPMGVVLQLYPGKDGIVRVVDVKTTSGVYRRPVAKLCKLDVHPQQNEYIIQQQSLDQ